MKKSTEILGLPVISITEGKDLGIVERLVVNKDSSKVEALATRNENWFKGVNLLAFTDILNIGESAVIISKESTIKYFGEFPDMIRMLDEDVTVIDTKVYSDDGQFIGHVAGFAVDKDGTIGDIEVIGLDKQIIVLPSDVVLIFGKEVTIVKDITGSLAE